ncbi:MAG: hypothetical protein ACN0LA_06875 [Candidatus Longimicrobiales bacterium M2_2A_002]
MPPATLRPARTLLLALAVATVACSPGQRADDDTATTRESAAAAVPRVEITYPASLNAGPLDGRLLLLFSPDEESEPRFTVSDGPGTGYVFGVDREGWAAGDPAVRSSHETVRTGGSAWGYPVESLAELPAGRYRVQAVLNIYETFDLADGRVLKLPPDRGEGQQWNRKRGNLLSTPMWVDWPGAADGDDGDTGLIEVAMKEAIPEIEPPEDTEWVKHVRIRSDLLSEFWGRDMYLGAHVLLPAGFEDEPDRRYPLAVFHGHFPYDFGGWRTTPPDPDAECVYSARFDRECYNRTADSAAYALYQAWTSPDFPRMLVIEVQHANPYYDDSYAVNSANLGPYGDAITHELIPYIEEQFRGIGEGWSRFLYGGSTGGWEAAAVQIFYPDEYNGAWIACPDPIDFRAYTVVDLYENENAYHLDGDPNQTPRPGHRDWLGHISSMIYEMNHKELALGTKTRSGQQWDIWEAVYSPVAPDGYPARIWDKVTGEIDRDVADYWRENYDLVHIMRRDWATLGPKLAGKLHIYVGDMDNYYLNNAVYLAEDFLESTTDPHYAGEVEYGDRAEHCWNGDQTRPNALSRLRYIQMYAPEIVRRLRETGHGDAVGR